MTDQQKSDRDKTEQAWLMHCFQIPKKMPARHASKQAIDDFKSSLKRDIEKRIGDLEKTDGTIQILECKRFLELIETVEP